MMIRTTVEPAVVIGIKEGEELRFADVTGFLKIDAAASSGRFAAGSGCNSATR
jgi:hypothetical protein